MIKSIKKSTVAGKVMAPSSKSYAQRAIVAASLAVGETVIRNLSMCGDIEAALRAAKALGAGCILDGSRIVLTGRDGGVVISSIDAGESGLLARMLIPVAATFCGHVTVCGSGTLTGRPVDMLAGPLESLGAEVSSDDGRLPVTVKGPIRGGVVAVDGAVSSQAATGLLMALPMAQDDSILIVRNPHSTPYLDITLDVMERFGIVCERDGYTEFRIPGRQRYAACDLEAEGDWSGAACMLVAGAVAGEVCVGGLDIGSKQADVRILDALRLAGACVEARNEGITVRKPERLTAFRFDATHCPDLFPALAALAANCEGESAITGAERLRHKESDRARAIMEEFGKLGVGIGVYDANTMKIRGGALKGAQVDAHGDHRMAMSLAVAALTADGEVTICGAGAVDKSYPAFWDDLARITCEVK